MSHLEQYVIYHPDRAAHDALRASLTANLDHMVEFRMHNNATLALRAIRVNPPKIVVLAFDANTGKSEGLIRAIKASMSMPVLCVGPKDELNEALALSLGADDYVAPDKSPRILVSRMKALMRRYHEYNAPASIFRKVAAAKDCIIIGNFELRPKEYKVLWKGHPADLTASEYRVLQKLAETNRLHTRDSLAQCFNAGQVNEMRNVDSMIKRIRLKFRAVDGGFNGIEMVYGSGYKIRERADNQPVRPANAAKTTRKAAIS